MTSCSNSINLLLPSFPECYKELQDAQEKDRKPIKRALLGVVELEDQLNNVDNVGIREALRRIKLH